MPPLPTGGVARELNPPDGSRDPSNLRVGYPIDWADGFPSKAIGPPDNDGQPLPAFWAFGFDDGPGLLRARRGTDEGLA